MILDIIIAGSCGGAGICCGWVMHALHRAGGPTTHSQTHVLSHPLSTSNDAGRQGNVSINPHGGSSQGCDGNQNEAIPAKQVAAVTDRVRAFVSIIAANVDQHRTQVDAVNGVLSGSDLSAAPPEIIAAVEQLLAANDKMRDQLEESQDQLREQSIQLQSAEQRAETDALTGVANRGAFNKRLAQRHAAGHTAGPVMAILDIDFFKRFNDEHGHRVGDEVLRSVAQMLEARLQSHGMVARFGGEEFCVLVDNLAYPEAIEVIEQTRAAISNREVRFEGKRLKVSASAGIGKLLANQSTEKWLQHVDDALYRSKDAGRNCGHYIDAERFIRIGGAPAPAPDATTRIQKPTSAPESPDEVLSAIQIESSGLASDLQTAVLPRNQSPAATDPIVPDEVVTGQDVGVGAERVAERPEKQAETQAEELLQRITKMRASEPTERPKSLAYLPDREAMMDTIHEAVSSPNQAGNRACQLMAVSLSGQPGAATMRSLLQMVRAAMRSQDRIGCLNQTTLLVCLPECEAAEAAHRAEQICSAAAAVGVSLATFEKLDSGERLSIGIVQLAGTDSPLTYSMPTIDQAILQTQAVAMLAGRQKGNETNGKLPVLASNFQAESRRRESVTI